MRRKLLKHILRLAGMLIILFAASSSFGQYTFTTTSNFNSSPQFTADSIATEIDYNHTFLSLNSDANANANGITNEFARQFYLSHYLDTELKTKSLDRLKSGNNLIGYNWSTQLKLNVSTHKTGLGYYVAFENHDYGELRFDKNLFLLVFFGNKDFAGQNVSLDKQSFKLLNFQQLKAGFVKTWFAKSHVNVFSAGLGINNGQSLLSYTIPKATFFTQDNAEYINLDMQMNMKRSDTTSSKFGAENGLGLCLDLYFYHRDAHNSIEIKMEDLGFITWSKYSQHFNKDTIVYFDGIEIDNIFNLDAQNIHLLTGDSLRKEFTLSKETSRFTELIPMKGSITYTRYLCRDRLSLSLCLVNYHFMHFFPQIRFVPSWRIHIKRSLLCVNPELGYGGYGKWNCGLGLTASVNQKFFIELRTGYLNSYVSMKNSAGLGGYVSIIKTL
jgi:hypothetical protein